MSPVFRMAFSVVAVLIGCAAAAQAQKISQFPNQPGIAALPTDAFADESSACPLSNGNPGNCRVTVQQILNAGLAQYLTTGAVTGSGNTVLAVSPTLVTPSLGTPSAIDLTNATSLPCSAMPALTGSITTTAGSCVTSGGGGGGGVSTVSVVTAGGFSGSVANATSTPAITLSTTATGMLKGLAGSLVAATGGTDFLAPQPITASAAGTIQSNATAITTTTTIVTTVASGSGVRLSLPFQTIGNLGANALLVYPNTGASINWGGTPLSTNAPFTLDVGRFGTFYCTNSTTCYISF